MKQQYRYPFSLREAFFASIRFARPGEVENDDGTLAVSIRVNVEEKDYPRALQVALAVKSEDEESIEFEAVLIGLFEAVNDFNAPADEFIPDFLNERALFLLWPYLVQTVKQMTTMMGIRPIRLQTPYHFGLQADPANNKPVAN